MLRAGAMRGVRGKKGGGGGKGKGGKETDCLEYWIYCPVFGFGGARVDGGRIGFLSALVLSHSVAGFGMICMRWM